jgi:type VI secretion system protein ImpA
MATAPLLDFDELVAPLPGESPAGEPVSFAVRTQLEEDRKEVDPSTFAPDDPTRPSEPKPADWDDIIELARKTLTTTSKDLLVAARLTEALVKKNGFAGLADGLHLLRRLVDECWDRLHPVIEDGDGEVRAGPFNWLGDADRGSRMPATLRTIPLVTGAEATYSWFDWRQVQDNRPGIKREDFEKAVASASRESCRRVVEDLTRSQEEFDGLVISLGDRLGPVAPGMTGLRQALGECLTLARQIVLRKGPEAAPVEAPAEATEPAEVQANGQPAVARTMASRAEVYQRLAEAADLLEQLEPHSPIPYLLRRAVELGGLPFPLLMRALIRDENVLGEMQRELGIKPAEEGGGEHAE